MSSLTIVKNRFKAFNNQEGRCFYCGGLMWLKGKERFAKRHGISRAEAEKFKCTAEHLLARSEGGVNREDNIVAACLFCNQKRHGRKKPPAPEKYKKMIEGRLCKGKWHPRSLHHLLSS